MTNGTRVQDTLCLESYAWTMVKAQWSPLHLNASDSITLWKQQWEAGQGLKTRHILSPMYVFSYLFDYLFDYKLTLQSLHITSTTIAATLTRQNSSSTSNSTTSTSRGSIQVQKGLRWAMGVVFVSPVPRPQKDCNWTGPRPQSGLFFSPVFDFWKQKTAERLDLIGSLRPVKTGFL